MYDTFDKSFDVCVRTCACMCVYLVFYIHVIPTDYKVVPVCHRRICHVSFSSLVKNTVEPELREHQNNRIYTNQFPN